MRGWIASARDAHALAHPAGELRRPLVLLSRQVHQRQGAAAVRVHLHRAPRRPARAHRERHVAQHAQPRQQRVALEDHRAVQPRALDLAPVHQHRAAIRAVEAGEDVQHRGLAAAGVADQADELALGHVEPDVVEHRAVGAGETTAQPLHGDVGPRTHAGRKPARPGSAQTRQRPGAFGNPPREAPVARPVPRQASGFQRLAFGGVRGRASTLLPCCLTRRTLPAAPPIPAPGPAPCP